jgi:sec-independent protein translocase protein TatB
MARQSELDDLRKEVDALRRGDFAETARGDVEGTFRAIDQDLSMPGVGGEAPIIPRADEAALEAADDLEAEPELPFGEPQTEARP